MKIDNNDPVVQGMFPEKTAKSRPADEREFGKILKETIGKAQKPDAGSHQTAFVNPLASVRLTTQGVPDPKFAIERIENMIDLLDQYRHKLADPQMNLKQIDPIIGEIARENDRLAALADSLPENDNIKPILDRTMVTASLEVTKFYRGDYLPA